MPLSHTIMINWSLPPLLLTRPMTMLLLLPSFSLLVGRLMGRPNDDDEWQVMCWSDTLCFLTVWQTCGNSIPGQSTCSCVKHGPKTWLPDSTGPHTKRFSGGDGMRMRRTRMEWKGGRWFQLYANHKIRLFILRATLCTRQPTTVSQPSPSVTHIPQLMVMSRRVSCPVSWACHPSSWRISKTDLFKSLT